MSCKNDCDAKGSRAGVKFSVYDGEKYGSLLARDGTFWSIWNATGVLVKEVVEMGR